MHNPKAGIDGSQTVLRGAIDPPGAQPLFIVFALIVSLTPALPLVFVHGADTAFLLLTGDAYLYLGIAQASTPEFFSFDGERPTNGFHPLWQLWVRLLAWVIGDAPLVLMNAVAWSAVACVTAGVLLLGAAIHRATGSWLLGLLAAPGLHYLLVGQGLGNLAVWNFHDGMEAGLTFALTGLAAWLVAGMRADERRPGVWLALGAVLAVLMFARLDEVFVPLCVGLAWLVWKPRDFLVQVPAVILLGLPSAIVLGLYWLYNWHTVGVLMPVSGGAKGEGALLGNLYVTAVTFFAPLYDLRALVSDYAADRNGLTFAAFRPVQVVFPALLAGFFVVILHRRFREAPWAPIMAGFCAAILVKAAYNAVAVNYWHQASWYFGFACAALSFTAALLFAPVAARLRAQAPEVGLLVAVTVVLVGLMQASQSYARRAESPELAERRGFWEARAEIGAALAAATAPAPPKLLEFGDGFLNFSLALPVRHGFVFAGDPQSLAALRAGRLLADAQADGYGLLASYEYLRWPAASTERSSDEIRAYLRAAVSDDRVRAELDRFDFRVVHVHQPLTIPFIAFRPRGAGDGGG